MACNGKQLTAQKSLLLQESTQLSQLGEALHCSVITAS